MSSAKQIMSRMVDQVNVSKYGLSEYKIRGTEVAAARITRANEMKIINNRRGTRHRKLLSNLHAIMLLISMQWAYICSLVVCCQHLVNQGELL